MAGWLASLPDIHARLAGSPPARVLDVACGAGWSSLAIAAAYPDVRVDAIDLDETVIALARRHGAEAGLGDRVSFRSADAADPGLEGPYDLVTCFEALHDMVDPVRVIARRVAAAPGPGRGVPGDRRPRGARSSRRPRAAWSVSRTAGAWSTACRPPWGRRDRPRPGR